jgi:hypothetical protein
MTVFYHEYSQFSKHHVQQLKIRTSMDTDNVQHNIGITTHILMYNYITG